MQQFMVIVIAYLVGSISFAVLVSRVMGLPDPRSYGSHNPGATNVLRSGKRTAAVLTLLGDAAKGWFAVWLAAKVTGTSSVVPGWPAGLAGLAALLGHLYPLFHRFRGGKGVATAAGVLFGLNPWLGLATVLTWGVIAGLLRYSSLAALVAAFFAPLYTGWLFGLQPVLGCVAAIAALVAWRHRANVRRLLEGSESKLGERPQSSPQSSR